MKNIKIITGILLLSLIGCSEEFLEKLPLDQLTVQSTFTSNANFETFAWGFYDTFEGYHRNDRVSYNQEMDTDLMVNNSGSQGAALLWQRITVPSTSSNWTEPYVQIRRANLMLENIDNGQLSDSEKGHWRSVGLFFRAWQYINLLKNYGGVPWIDKVLNSDDEALFGPRDSRDTVAQNILTDLLSAEANIDIDGNGFSINRDIVRAVISRFGLIEGTFRKYHSLGGEQQYLQASVTASTALMTDNPTLHPNYDEVFNSEILSGKSGILLYKAYEFAILTGNYSHYNRSSIGNEDLTKKMADKYLLLDGETIHTSTMFDGEEDMYDEFRNRDTRMYMNTTPPYRVDTGGSNRDFFSYLPDGSDFVANGKTYVINNEYIDLMATLTDDTHKTLPDMNWRGLIVRSHPHFRKFNEGHGYNVTYSGYAFHKYYNKIARLQNQDSHDAPLFRMGEVLLNHAEATFELGQFNQAVADATINKLRDRGSVAHLNIATIVADPTRDADVDEVLWEIRRERAVEYLGEGFGRAYDLRRWKKMVEYGAVEKVGKYIVASDYNNKVPVVGGAAEGYVKIFGTPPGVLAHYYLEPVPSDQIVLNPALEQNPGW